MKHLRNQIKAIILVDRLQEDFSLRSNTTA